MCCGEKVTLIGVPGIAPSAAAIAAAIASSPVTSLASAVEVALSARNAASTGDMEGRRVGDVVAAARRPTALVTASAGMCSMEPAADSTGLGLAVRALAED